MYIHVHRLLWSKNSHFFFLSCSKRRVRSSKSRSPPSAEPVLWSGNEVLGTGGRSRLGGSMGIGGGCTPDWGPVGWGRERGSPKEMAPFIARKGCGLDSLRTHKPGP